MWTTEDKQAALDAMHADWSNCEACGLCKERSKVVFGEGNPNADIMLIGEAPGATEDEEGRPFVGESGTLLDVMLQAAKLDRDSLYITNLVSCRPPENRQPLTDEKKACAARLYSQIYIIDPLLIISVGKEALQFLTGSRSLDMGRSHGKLQADSVKIPRPPSIIFPRKDETKREWYLTYNLIPIYHPSYILRTDSYDEEKDTWQKNGPAQLTLIDLIYARKMIGEIRSEYTKAYKYFKRRAR